MKVKEIGEVIGNTDVIVTTDAINHMAKIFVTKMAILLVIMTAVTLVILAGIQIYRHITSKKLV